MKETLEMITCLNELNKKEYGIGAIKYLEEITKKALKQIKER